MTKAGGDASICAIHNKQRTRWSASSTSKSGKSDANHEGYCGRCGQQHDQKFCPAANRYCSRCNKKGHHRKMCTSKTVHDVNNDETESDNDEEENNEYV